MQNYRKLADSAFETYETGATVYLDGEVRVQIITWWPKGSTSQLGPHYTVQVCDETRPVQITLHDRTGSATEVRRLQGERRRVHPSRLSVRRERTPTVWASDQGFRKALMWRRLHATWPTDVLLGRTPVQRYSIAMGLRLDRPRVLR